MSKLRTTTLYSYLLRLFIAGENVFGPFPRREVIKLAHFLDEFHGFINHALFLIIITHFNIACDREIFAQRVAAEAVVSQNAAQVWMAGEYHAVKIIDFAFKPIGGWEYFHSGRHFASFVNSYLHANAGVFIGAEQMIDHIEALFAFRVIGTTDIDEGNETAIGIVMQEL